MTPRLDDLLHEQAGIISGRQALVAGLSTSAVQRRTTTTPRLRPALDRLLNLRRRRFLLSCSP